MTSLVAKTVKHLFTMRKTWVQSLGWEDSLEKKWQPTPVPLHREQWSEHTNALWVMMGVMVIRRRMTLCLCSDGSGDSLRKISSDTHCAAP